MRNSESRNRSSQLSKKSLLKIAEYSSLAASVLGIVVATASRQVFYAAAPLSMSMFLNILNRQKFEEQVKRNLSTKIVRVEKHFSKIDRAFSQLQQELNKTLAQRNTELDRKISIYEKEKANFAHFETKLSQIHQSLLEESEAVSRQVQFINSFVTPASIQSIQQRLSELNNRIIAIESLNITQIHNQYKNISQFSSQIRQELDSLKQKVETGFDSQQFDRLQNQLQELETWRKQQSITDRELAKLQDLISNRQQESQLISQLQEDLTRFQSQIDRRFSNLTSQEEITNLKDRLEQLLNWQQQQDFSQLDRIEGDRQQQLDLISQLQQDLTGFKEAIEQRFHNLSSNDRIQNLQTQLEQLLSWQQQQDFSQLNNLAGDRQQQLDLISQLQQDLTGFKEAIEQRFANLTSNEQIQNLQTQLEQLLSWQQQQDFSQLNNLAGDRQQQLDLISQLQQDLTGFKEAIEQRFANLTSNEQIQNLQTQLEQLLSWQQQQDFSQLDRIEGDRQQQLDLISQLQQDLTGFKEAIEQRFHNLSSNDRIQNLQTQLEQLLSWQQQQDFSQLNNLAGDRQQQLDLISQLQQDLTGFKEAIEHRFHNLSPKEEIQNLQSQLEQDLTGFKETIEHRFHNLSSNDQIQNLQSQLEQLLSWQQQQDFSQLNNLAGDRQQQLDLISQLQQDLAAFQESIEHRVQKLSPEKQIQNLQAQLEHVLGQLLDWQQEQDFSQLDNLTDDCRQQLDLILKLQQDLTGFKETIEHRFQKLSPQEEIQYIQTQLEQLLTWKQQQIDWERELEQLRGLIQDLRQRQPDRREGDRDHVDLEILALNLGIDFGTSFTKVCFRDIAQDRSEIINFGDRQIDLNEALLPTKIAILTDGTLITGLTATEWNNCDRQIEKSIDFMKMRLADLDLPQQNDNWRLEYFPELEDPENVENLCAYYLCCIIKRAQTWILQHKPDLVLDRQLEWTANIGVPVQYCDSPAIDRFEKVLSLAWLLSNEPLTESFTLQSLGDRLRDLRHQLDCTQIDCHAIPELAAEAWSFISAVGSPEGFYTFFDIGDGTVDGAAFHYWQDGGEPKVDFYAGLVQSLGVSAISQALARELDVSLEQVKTVITTENSVLLPEIKSSQSRRQIQQLVGRIAIEGSQQFSDRQSLLKEKLLKDGLNMFIGGGGSQTNFFTEAILDTHHDFQHQNIGIPSYNCKDLPLPKDLDLNGLNHQEFYRFAVAYGLSLPQWEVPEIKLPSAIAAWLKLI
jgi:hypothetical protein